MNWINCENKLPPKDGTYFCTNDPNLAWKWGMAEYDSYGFKSCNISRNPTHWSSVDPVPKKYGIQHIQEKHVEYGGSVRVITSDRRNVNAAEELNSLQQKRYPQ